MLMHGMIFLIELASASFNNLLYGNGCSLGLNAASVFDCFTFPYPTGGECWARSELQALGPSLDESCPQSHRGPWNKAACRNRALQDEEFESTIVKNGFFK